MLNGEGFVQKPFSIAPFAEKLKEVLGEVDPAQELGQAST